jgi:AraC-like DNA-binding protein
MNSSSASVTYPDDIELSLIGVNDIHASGYVVDRKDGTRGYLLEYFQSPVFLQDGHGRKRYDAGVFILYAPGQTQYFQGDGSLRHSWVQIVGEGVSECLERYKIPVNQAIPLDQTDFLTPHLEEAQRQLVRRLAFAEDAISEIARNIFRQLARALYAQYSGELTPYQRDLFDTLLRVRAQVFKEVDRRWTIDDMSSIANMSQARFCIAYKANFGSGPIDDLIDFRLRHAELMLRRLPISVSDAAQFSGFNSIPNFHVLFRKRFGRSPSSNRKNNGHTISAVDPRKALFNSASAKKVDLLYFRPEGHWSFDSCTTAEIFDDLRKHPKAEVHHYADFVAGRAGGKALNLNGAGYLKIPTPIVDTSHSYTVCAWLKRDQQDKMTAVSIGGAHHGAFYLQHIPHDGGFVFVVSRSAKDRSCIFLVSREQTLLDRWYFVVAIHDANLSEIRLYVDGDLSGATPYETPWRTDGATYFGCSHVMGVTTDEWTGALDDIRIYDYALTNDEIRTIYRSVDDTTN